MISCREVSEKASAVIDGQLPSRQRLPIILHLLMCRNCRRFMVQFRVLVDGLRRPPKPVTVAPAFVDRADHALSGLPSPIPHVRSTDHE